MDKYNNFNMVDTAMRMSSMAECPRNCVTTDFPDDTVVAMAYVPFQLDKTSYSAEKALCEGTLFPVLNKPFLGRSVLNG